jgi:predicted DsbA family dithiol-disulfide isomerase
MRVEIVSDVVCPWCFIGMRRFERARAALRADGIEIEVAWRPFQLDPSAPVGSPTPVAEAYAAKFGGPERAARILDDVTRLAAAEGERFDMARALRANTFDAHRLLAWAESVHGGDAQHALADSLFTAYFCEGLDLGDVDVLAARADALGLTGAHAALTSGAHADEVRAALAEARDRGVTAVPTYVVDGSWSIPGAQDAEVFERLLRRVASA